MHLPGEGAAPNGRHTSACHPSPWRTMLNGCSRCAPNWGGALRILHSGSCLNGAADLTNRKCGATPMRLSSCREAAWHSQEYGTHRNESPRGLPQLHLLWGGLCLSTISVDVNKCNKTDLNCDATTHTHARTPHMHLCQKARPRLPQQGPQRRGWGAAGRTPPAGSSAWRRSSPPSRWRPASTRSRCGLRPLPLLPPGRAA